MKDSWVQYEIKSGIGWITLNRPQKRNAVTAEMRDSLYLAYQDVKRNPEVAVAIITGAGPVFCSGEDLTDPNTHSTVNITSEELDSFQQTVYTPIIAAVNGPAMGQGTRFVFSSDIVIMADRASLAWPHARIGLSSVSGPTVLTQYLTWPLAMKHLLLGVPIPAEECVQLGLANEVVKAEALTATAERWAMEIMSSAPLAVRGIKEAARRGESLPLESRKLIANDIFSRVMRSEDATEGVRAFKERRRPVWAGK